MFTYYGIGTNSKGFKVYDASYSASAKRLLPALRLWREGEGGARAAERGGTVRRQHTPSRRASRCTRSAHLAAHISPRATHQPTPLRQAARAPVHHSRRRRRRCPYTYRHKCILYMLKCIPIVLYILACIHTCINAYRHACLQAYIHTYIHVYYTRHTCLLHAPRSGEKFYFTCRAATKRFTLRAAQRRQLME